MTDGLIGIATPGFSRGNTVANKRLPITAEVRFNNDLLDGSSQVFNVAMVRKDDCIPA